MREYNYKILNTKLYLLSILVGCFSGVFATGFRWVLDKLKEIKLPLNCSIIKVSVSENKNLEINNDTKLYKGNFILVRISDEGYEYLFKTIRTLANE